MSTITLCIVAVSDMYFGSAADSKGLDMQLLSKLTGDKGVLATRSRRVGCQPLQVSAEQSPRAKAYYLE